MNNNNHIKNNRKYLFRSKRMNNNTKETNASFVIHHHNSMKTGNDFRCNNVYHYIFLCFTGFTLTYITTSNIGTAVTSSTTTLRRQTTTIDIPSSLIVVDNDSINNYKKVEENNNSNKDGDRIAATTPHRVTASFDTFDDNIRDHNNNNNENNNNREETPIVTTGSNPIVRYVKDALCSGCRYSYSNEHKNTTCYYEIHQLLQQNPNLSIVEAGTIVSSYNINYCQRCHPTNGCNENDKIYYRPDDVVASSYIEYATTHFLQSIHIDDRIPHNVLMSEEIFNEFVSNPNNILPNREYYFEFNPSITHLPKSQIPVQLLKDSGYPNVNIDTDRFYIASYRVSTGHHCYKEPEEIKIRYLNGTRVKVIDYLGIAILDVNLNILVETVVDPKSAIVSTIRGESQPYQDGRLFNFNNQLYMGSFTKLYPIWINPPLQESDYNLDNPNVRFQSDPNKLKIILMSHYMKSRFKLNKVWNDDVEKYNQLPVYIHQKAYCSNDHNQQRFAKSLNYFQDTTINHTNNKIVMELFPMGPKEYLHDEYCIDSNKSIDFILPNQPIPQQSYGTTDELEMSNYNQTKLPYHSNRGSTCCISIIDPRDDTKTLLIGISHKRSSPQGKPIRIHPLMYFNNFYAMESIAPYNIVARSGRFCFEYPKSNNNNDNSTTTGNNQNNINEMNFTYPRMTLNLQIGNEHYNNCPSIQFITGMVEAIHDSNKVIISYGVDDCLSRFIIIDKKHIITLLFNPSYMLLHNNNNGNNNIRLIDDKVL